MISNNYNIVFLHGFIDAGFHLFRIVSCVVSCHIYSQ